MVSNRVFLLLSLVCLFPLGKGEEVEKQDVADVTANRIRDEIQRLIPVEKALQHANLNITVSFHHESKKGEDGFFGQTDKFVLRPFIPSKPHPSGYVFLENLGEDAFAAIFKVAEKLNLTAVASRAVYDESGVLASKSVITPDIASHYHDGVSKVLLKDTSELKTLEDFTAEKLMSRWKRYETPVDVITVAFDENGEVVAEDFSSVLPRKVNIVKGTMSIERQLHIAAILKTVFTIQTEPKERAHLLCKYLKNEEFRSTYIAVVGEDPHAAHCVNHQENVVLELEGEVYHVYIAEKKMF